MKRHSGSRDILPVIPNLRTRWRCVINFTLRPFYPWEETPVPLEKEAGWAQKLNGAVCKTEKSLAPGLIQTPDGPAHSLQLYCLLYPDSLIQYSSILKGNLFLSIVLKMPFTAVHCSFFLVC